MEPYAVKKYSILTLRKLLDSYSHKGQGYSKIKGHLHYLDEYLKSIKARTIIVENTYTDKDYLEDYAAYYARCHDDYKRKCGRFHFFSDNLNAKIIDQILAGDSKASELLQSSYLGFIVVKPLPSTIIGRTCLALYENAARKRNFAPACDYKVHFLGIELSVHSVPFQEQDTDVAACATSALWSMFHITGRLFQHRIPTPAEITKAATSTQTPVNRALPASSGLSAEQMADAIRSVGLEPLQIGVSDLGFLKICACAYLKARIPCVLVGELIEIDPKPKTIGFHAITIVGSGEPSGSPDPFGRNNILFRSVAVDRLYSHDDQVGPFASLKFDPAKNDAVLTSWRDDKKNIGNIVFKPYILLVPLYHKVRVPVSSIVKTLSFLDHWIETGRGAGLISHTDRIVWDVFLSENAVLKSDIYSDQNILPSFRTKTLTDEMPRYVWRAIAKSANSNLFELLFDATDLLQGGYIIGGLPYSSAVCTEISVLFNNSAVAKNIRETNNRGFEMAVRWFTRHTGKF